MTKLIVSGFLGVVGGFVAGWILATKNYAKRAAADQAAIREYYENKGKDSVEDTTDQEPVRTDSAESSIAEINRKLKDQVMNTNYQGYFKTDESPRGHTPPLVPVGRIDPEVIDDHEFDEENGFEKKSLLYYLDGVVTDEDDQVMEDWGVILGTENINTMVNANEMLIYIRDHVHEIDYEVSVVKVFWRDLQPPEYEAPMSPSERHAAGKGGR